jgi:TPR repeat protein
MNRLLVSSILLLAALRPAWAGTDESLSAMQRGDYAGALQTVVTPIENGVSSALDKALPPMVHGLATLETLVGDMYYYGHGVSRDYSEAASWYRGAAEKGSALAQSTLGDIYYYGRGVPQDYVEAVKWWQLAADQGVAVAQLNLSVMYANGDGVAQDYVKAHLYANLAAAHLPPGEDHDIAVKNREIVAKLMTPAQVAEAQREAREWQARASQ